MSGEEKDALLGRLYREKKELTEDIRLLKARLSELGQQLSALGAALKSDPATVIFSGQSFNPQIVSPRTAQHSIRGASEPELRELTESLRQKMDRLVEVERDLA